MDGFWGGSRWRILAVKRRRRCVRQTKPKPSIGDDLETTTCVLTWRMTVFVDCLTMGSKTFKYDEISKMCAWFAHTGCRPTNWLQYHRKKKTKSKNLLAPSGTQGVLAGHPAVLVRARPYPGHRQEGPGRSSMKFVVLIRSEGRGFQGAIHGFG